MDTHLLSNEVLHISSLLTIHLLKLFIITAVLSGDDEYRPMLHSFPVCCSFINLLITSSLSITLGLVSSTILLSSLH